MGGINKYDDEQRATFIEMAQRIGIGRTIRELKYPSFPTAQHWMEAAGVKPNTDTAFQAMKQWHTFYQVEDMLMIIDEGLSLAQDMLSKASNADDAKKLSESLQKLVNTRLLLEGKSTSITEKRETTQQDLEIAELMRAERAKQSTRKNITEDNEAPVVTEASLYEDIN